MPILHKKSKRKKKREKDEDDVIVGLSNRGVSTYQTHLFASNSVATPPREDTYSQAMGICAPTRDSVAPCDYSTDLLTFSYDNNNSIEYMSSAIEQHNSVNNNSNNNNNNRNNSHYNNNNNFNTSNNNNNHGGNSRGSKTAKKWRLSSRFKFKDCGNDTSGKGNEMTSEGSASNLRQEFLKQVVARRALENEKAELSRHIAQRDSLICDLRKQLIQKEKTLHLQRSHFEEAIRNIQNGKPYQPFQGESPAGRSSGREELQLVREAISALRGNFRGTDPNQHTLDTLEQAIAVLMERNASCNTTDVNTIKKEKRSMNASTNEPFTKVIYFTDRTVTPFMSCINKRLGDVTLRDFKTLFDRPGNFRFHFKSHDPEYGLVKEEILNNDDVLPGVDGKIIAWVEEDLD